MRSSTKGDLQVNWFFSEEDVETILIREGSTLKKDFELRKSTINFLQEIGSKLKMPHKVIATACVYFHRFFLLHLFHDFDRYIVAGTCLYLSSKMLNDLKNINEIIYIYEELLLLEKTTHETFLLLKEKFLNVEFVLLKTINFEFYVDLPHKFLEGFIKQIRNRITITKEVEFELHKKSRSFADDSLRTRAILTYEPQEIAATSIFLGSKYMSLEIPFDKIQEEEGITGKEELFFKTSKCNLKRICFQIFDLYDETSENFLKMKKRAFEVQILFKLFLNFK
eukprot:gene10079-2500_t